MKVRFTTAVSGRGFAYGDGEVIDLPASLAKYWIGEGAAVEYKEKKEPVQKPLRVQQVKKTKTRPVKR